MHMGNRFHSAIGRPFRNGEAFPVTAGGDEIHLWANPPQAMANPGMVAIAVNLHVGVMSPQEARLLAAALLKHADQAEARPAKQEGQA